MSVGPRFRTQPPRAVLLAVSLAISAMAGCASSPPTQHAPPAPPTTSLPPSVAVARYSRYTLVEIEPTPAQSDLLAQVIDITLPPMWSATVGDALRYLLLRSGYTLCEGHADTDELARLPLPASQFHLGPLRLRQALELLAGPAWQLDVDDRVRSVCYARPAPAAGSAATGSQS